MSQSNILAEQKAAIEQAEQALQESKEFFEKHGLDPEKTKAFLASRMTPEMRAQNQAAFEADMIAIEQEVGEQMARLSSNVTETRTAPRPFRKMI
ncbi:hypothetical protein [Ottowia thiooxydans]|uniref:hypothetical protein n=1 Tax=Ottowia thiooxydans TaxID=219182 RepID=UPI00040E7DE9|nr:hypothetical protein [Ottowia thiooxydans]